MNDELKDYIERHRNWQNLALSQFSFTNNLMLTISFGFLAFIFGKWELSSMPQINWLYIGTLGFLILSIYEGIIVVISRLYDFRISRHVAYTRMRYYKKKKGEDKGTLPDFDFKRPNFCNRVNAICKVFFYGLELLTQDEIKNLDHKFYEEKFNSLRELSNTLGIVSWNGLKWQTFSLFFACLFFVTKIMVA